MKENNVIIEYSHNKHRKCLRSKKWYDEKNRLNGRLIRIGDYVILPMARHPEDSWYKGCYIRDEWCVLENTGRGFLQQISPIYSKYGNAVRFLEKKAKEDYGV